MSIADSHPTAAFYRTGHYAGIFRSSPIFGTLQNVLREIYTKPLKDGFSWLQKGKYIGSKDLRPHAYEYDPVFVDLLFDQGIPAVLEQLTGSRLFLFSMNLRINMPGVPYSTWHRDTSFYRGKQKGIVPPAINLHYYPRFDEAPEPQLRIWPGTHHAHMPLKFLDRLLVRYLPGLTLVSNNDTYSVLNTGILHQIAPTAYPRGAIRLMYSFAHEFQLAVLPEFSDLQNYYRSRLLL